MRLSSTAGAGAAAGAAAAVLALGSGSALLWEAWADWAALAFGARFLGPPAAAVGPLHT